MLRRIVLFVCLAALAGVVYAQEEEGTFNVLEETTWTCPEGFAGQTLNLYNWSTYIGETTVRDFEVLCGVTVTYDVYESNESLIARLRQGNPGYDVVFPSDYAVKTMINAGLLEPIDISNIPNFANVAERWVGLDFDPENEYSVPYLWGTLGVGYRKSAFATPPGSWEDVWTYTGPVAWINDVRIMISIGLLMSGFDPNSVEADEVAIARDYLLDRSSNVVVFADDDGQTLLERGEVDIAIEYNGDMYQVIVECACDDYGYFVPSEGSIADIAAMVVPVGAQNPELALVFMDYVLDPVVNAAIVNYTLYPTPNQVAVESGLIPEEFLTNPAITPDDEALANMWFSEDIGEAEEIYNNAWDELRIFAGQ